jgi:hypothetical protein
MVVDGAPDQPDEGAPATGNETSKETSKEAASPRVAIVVAVTRHLGGCEACQVGVSCVEGSRLAEAVLASWRSRLPQVNPPDLPPAPRLDVVAAAAMAPTVRGRCGWGPWGAALSREVRAGGV